MDKLLDGKSKAFPQPYSGTRMRGRGGYPHACPGSVLPRRLHPARHLGAGQPPPWACAGPGTASPTPLSGPQLSPWSNRSQDSYSVRVSLGRQKQHSQPDVSTRWVQQPPAGPSGPLLPWALPAKVGNPSLHLAGNCHSVTVPPSPDDTESHCHLQQL